jgi:hypothetical protein
LQDARPCIEFCTADQPAVGEPECRKTTPDVVCSGRDVGYEDNCGCVDA